MSRCNLCSFVEFFLKAIKPAGIGQQSPYGVVVEGVPKMMPLVWDLLARMKWTGLGSHTPRQNRWRKVI